MISPPKRKAHRPPPPIGENAEEGDRGYRQYKRYFYKHFYEEHHAPRGHLSYNDYCWNGLLWVFLLLIGGLFISMIVWSFVHPPTPHSHLPPPYILTREGGGGGIGRKRSSECTIGEVYDSETGMCAPTFHAPLAFDGTLMDNNEPTCNSFYRKMCGKWNDQHTNENRAFSFPYYKNQHRIEQLVTFETEFRNGKVLETPSTSSLTDFYRSCLFASLPTKQQKESALVHKHLINTILNGASRVGDMPGIFGKLARIGYTTPFTISIERHPTEPRMIPLFAYDGFPDDVTQTQVEQIYMRTQHIHNLNILEREHHILSVLSIMHEMRMHSTRPVQSILNYAEYVATQFPQDVMPFSMAVPQQWNVRGHETMPGWEVYFQALDGTGLRFHHDQDVWVLDRDYFQWLFGRGLAKFSFAEWYAFVEFSILYNGHEFEPDLPSDVYFKQHDLQGPLGPGGRIYHRLPRTATAASNTTTHRPLNSLEHKCARITQHLLPGLVAKQFLQRHYPNLPEMKQEITTMVQGIIDSFVEMVDETAWMSSADKLVLKDKMHATLIRVAEPDVWEAEPFAESLSPHDYWGNLNMIRAYRVQRNLELWSRDDADAFHRGALAFFAVPLTDVNAYYSGPTNTITVLAGLLQSPIYDTRYNSISKYARLGSVLGHELSHMADNSGLYWGKQGSMHVNGILSEQGMRRFFEESACIVREYGPAPLGCEDANAHYGNSTLGEDLADRTGIELSYRTYFRRINEHAPLADKQHFFMVLAQSFCETYDQEHLCRLVAEDVHAIAMFRINRTFRNMRSFQQAFGCHQGQGMWKAEGEECRVYGA